MFQDSLGCYTEKPSGGWGLEEEFPIIVHTIMSFDSFYLDRFISGTILGALPASHQGASELFSDKWYHRREPAHRDTAQVPDAFVSELGSA